MPDKELVERLFRRHGAAIYERCRRLLGDDAAAEDALQEAFLRLHRSLARVPDEEAARLWIYRIATNVCLDGLRARVPRRQLAENPFDFRERPFEELLADRNLATVLVLRAPERIRPTAWAHHIDGFEVVEVGRLLGLSRRTVENYLRAFIESSKRLLRREPLL